MSPFGAWTAAVGMLNGLPAAPGSPGVPSVSSTSPDGACRVMVCRPVSATNTSSWSFTQTPCGDENLKSQSPCSEPSGLRTTTRPSPGKMLPNPPPAGMLRTPTYARPRESQAIHAATPWISCFGQPSTTSNWNLSVPNRLATNPPMTRRPSAVPAGRGSDLGGCAIQLEYRRSRTGHPRVRSITPIGAGQCTVAPRVEQVQLGGEVAHLSSASQHEVLDEALADLATLSLVCRD